jgi:hypothetical protein
MNAGRAIIAAGCAYEIAALPDRSPLPTITELVKTVGRLRFGRFVLWLWLGFIVDHFIEREVAA